MGVKGKTSAEEPARPGIWQWLWREVGWVIPAVSLALAIKFLVADVYSIPTGSMEPTLIGRARGGDRIFSPKCVYWFRANHGPNRWEPFLFKYPTTNRKDRNYGENFIKRCAGLPGETILFAGGDLYAAPAPGQEGRLLQKPLDLQAGVWIPVHRERFVAGNAESFSHYWQALVPGGWSLSPGVLHVDTDRAVSFTYRPHVPDIVSEGVTDLYVKRQAVTFRGPKSGVCFRATVDSPQVSAVIPQTGEFVTVADLAAFSESGSEEVLPGGLETRRSPEVPLHLVSDLRIAADIRPRAARGRFGLEITADERSWKAVVSLADGRAVVEENGLPLAEPAIVDIAPGRPCRLEFFRCDGRIVLMADGRTVASFDRSERKPAADFEYRSTGVRLEASDAALDILGVDVDRDVYYYWCGYGVDAWPASDAVRQFMRLQHAYVLPKDGYMALGDNQPNSNDSRYWGPVPADNLIGPALATFWPPHRMRTLY